MTQIENLPFEQMSQNKPYKPLKPIWQDINQ